MAVRVGVDGVVGGVGLELHHLHVGAPVARLCQGVGLLQRFHRLEHHGLAHPAPIGGAADNGAVAGAEGRDAQGGEAAGGGAVGQGDARRGNRAQDVAVTGERAVALVHDGLKVAVHRVRMAGGVHPAQPVVEALVDEELAPGDGAIGVEPLVAGHLQLGAEVERGVRVDQQQRVVVHGVRRRDGDAVGAGRRAGSGRRRGLVRRRGGGQSIEAGQLRERDALDVAADAALAEGERHPGLEPPDHPGRHLAMHQEVVVQAVGPAVHQRPQPGRASGVAGAEVGGVDVEPGPQVLCECRAAFGLGEAAEGGQVVGLDPVEVVLGLGIGHAEHSVGVGAAVDVGDAPVVARDGDPGGDPAEPGPIRCRGRRGGEQAEGGEEAPDPLHLRLLIVRVCVIGTGTFTGWQPAGPTMQ